MPAGLTGRTKPTMADDGDCQDWCTEFNCAKTECSLCPVCDAVATDGNDQQASCDSWCNDCAGFLF